MEHPPGCRLIPNHYELQKNLSVKFVKLKENFVKAGFLKL